MRFNFPLFLTWLRIVAIPLFVAVLYMPESWITERTANITSMWIFIARWPNRQKKAPQLRRLG